MDIFEKTGVIFKTENESMVFESLRDFMIKYQINAKDILDRAYNLIEQGKVKSEDGLLSILEKALTEVINSQTN